jgi:hypothetical protein
VDLASKLESDAAVAQPQQEKRQLPCAVAVAVAQQQQ